jgi:hypothetical protein
MAHIFKYLWLDRSTIMGKDEFQTLLDFCPTRDITSLK